MILYTFMEVLNLFLWRSDYFDILHNIIVL